MPCLAIVLLRYPCPAFENPADHILDIINLNKGGEEGEPAAAGGGETDGLKTNVSTDQRSAAVDGLVAAYKASAMPADMQALMEKGQGAALPDLEVRYQ